MNLLRLLSTINRKCDEEYLEKINIFYKKNIVSLFWRWHTIERLRQIPHIEIEKKIPLKGAILDIGCGRGGFSSYVALKSPDRKVLGIDTDKNRIKDALKVSEKISNIKFETKVIEDFIKEKKKFDVLLVMDILHHNNFEEQKIIVNQFYDLLKDDGLVVMLEPGDYPSIRHFFIWLSDYGLYPNSTTCKYRTESEWLELYKKNKFNLVSSEHITNRGLFFTRKIMVFKKVL